MKIITIFLIFIRSHTIIILIKIKIRAFILVHEYSLIQSDGCIINDVIIFVLLLQFISAWLQIINKQPMGLDKPKKEELNVVIILWVGDIDDDIDDNFIDIKENDDDKFKFNDDNELKLKLYFCIDKIISSGKIKNDKGDDIDDKLIINQEFVDINVDLDDTNE